jgi:hypothetical protein
MKIARQTLKQARSDRDVSYGQLWRKACEKMWEEQHLYHIGNPAPINFRLFGRNTLRPLFFGGVCPFGSTTILSVSLPET